MTARPCRRAAAANSRPAPSRRPRSPSRLPPTLRVVDGGVMDMKVLLQAGAKAQQRAQEVCRRAGVVGERVDDGPPLPPCCVREQQPGAVGVVPLLELL